MVRCTQWFAYSLVRIKSNTYFQGAAGEDDEARQRGSDEVDDEACGSTGLDDDDEARGGVGEDEVRAAGVGAAGTTAQGRTSRR